MSVKLRVLPFIVLPSPNPDALITGYNPDHAYQEGLAQQMKALQMQQESLAAVAAMTHGAGGLTGASGAQELLNLQAMLYQNPALLQQLLWMNMHQQQQQQQRDQVPQSLNIVPL